MSQPAVPTGRAPAAPEQILVLLEQADFPLSEPYLSELVTAYGYVQRLTSRIQRGYRHDEEPAHIFNPRAFEPKPGAGDAK
jgi:hypothetical protein